MEKTVKSAKHVDPRLFELLCCPKCRGELQKGEGSLNCLACRLRYPVIDGVPVMLPERAKRLK